MKNSSPRPSRPRHASAAFARARAWRLAPLLLAALCAAPARNVAQDKKANPQQPATTTQTTTQPATTQPAPSSQSATLQKPAPLPQSITREGVRVELNVEPAGGKSGALLEGTEATVTFKFTDTTTGQPVTSLRPAAWIDLKEANAPGATNEATACRDKIQSFVKSRLRARPDIDLNAYYILALNEEPNISVIDPLGGVGTTKLLTLVMLKSPGADWALSADQRRLFVSMPLVNQVAVVDTATWKVVSNVEAGARPVRLRLQRDGKYLWAATDGIGAGARGGVTVIDASTLEVAARIETGAGEHDITLSSDDRRAFVTNRQDGSVTVIDTARLAKLRDVKTGPAPAAVAYSAAGRAAYIVDEQDGSIVAVDAAGRASARVAARPGLSALHFAPDGRHGFAVNRKESAVHIFDAATGRLLHSVAVAPSPDQVAFTKQFAYVRSRGSEQVTMIRLAEIGRPAIEQATVRFPAGQAAPAGARSVAATAMVNAPEAGSMLVANPADQMIYYYMEGMAAPMGNFRNYRRQPLALLVWDASLRETSPGVYRAQVTLAGRGNYDVALLLDSPRVVNCFELAVAENPALAKKWRLPIKVEPLFAERVFAPGKEARLRFKVTDAETGRPKSDLKDMGVLAFLAPGIWQQREWARHVGEGVYEIAFTPPREGAYYVFFHCPSLGVQHRQLPHLILSAERRAAAAEKPADAARP